MKAISITVSAVALLSVASAKPTEVLFNFDTEDFTSPVSADGVLKLARLFTEEGVTAHFATVGYMARAFVQRERWDVIDALRPHLRLNHTLSHSVHPNLLEISDVKDFDVAYDAVLARETESIGMVKAATGFSPTRQQRLLCGFLRLCSAWSSVLLRRVVRGRDAGRGRVVLQSAADSLRADMGGVHREGREVRSRRLSQSLGEDETFHRLLPPEQGARARILGRAQLQGRESPQVGRLGDIPAEVARGGRDVSRTHP